MANLTIDNFLYFSGLYGCIQANDANHQIIIRGDRAGTASNYTNYYQYGGTIVAGLGHKFWTGGALVDQTLKFHIADDGNYFACKVGIGTSTPIGKLDVSTGGNTNIVISNDSTDTGYNIISLNGTRTKGSYAGIAGGGTGDNKLYLNSGVDVVIQTGASYTARMTITCCGAMYMSRISSNLTFPDNVGGMYVRQNGNGAGTEEELRIFGRNISLVSHTGTRYMDVTSTGKVGIGTTSGNGQLTVSVDQSSNNQHINIVGTQTSYSQEYSFGIPTSTKDLRIYDGTAGAVRLTLTCLGNLGLNTTTPGAYKLNVNGAFYAAGSSCEYKTSICNYNTDSCMFMKLKPVTYQYKDEYCHLGKELKSGTQIGLIAEDTAEVFPELAILKEEENEKVVRNVDYEKLTIILLSEVQKLRQEVDQLKNK